MATGAALAVMLGADVGTALMAVVFSFDLSWLSPLLIFVGVVMFVSRQNSAAGRIGRVLIGLGLITLALQLIVGATRPLTESPAVRALLVALPNEVLLDIVVGAVLTVLSYSSLAIVLLTATLAASGMVPAPRGAGPGARRQPRQRRAGDDRHRRRGAAGAPAAAGQPGVQAASGALLAIPLLPQVHALLQQLRARRAPAGGACSTWASTSCWRLLFIGFTGVVARLVERWLPAPRRGAGTRPRHLDPVALATPSLAISCAAREALHQADVVETMLRGMLPVIRNNDLELAERLRRMDDTVDELYSAIKFYLTQISREALSEREGRRWTDIVSFTINMEQIGDIIERVLQDVEDKKIRKNRSFSDAGMAEICHLHERLLANLRLGMSVFLDGHVRDAQKLLEEKARFRDLEHEYAANHIARLQDNTRAEHRDQLAAPGPDQRAEAHQLAHLLDRLPDPRVGRRAGRHADAPFAAGGAGRGASLTADAGRHRNAVRTPRRRAVQRRAGDAARARAADAPRWPKAEGADDRADHRRAAARPGPPAARPGRYAHAARPGRRASVRRAALPARAVRRARCSTRSGCMWMPSASCAPRGPTTSTRCRPIRSAAWRCRAASSMPRRRQPSSRCPARPMRCGCACGTTAPRRPARPRRRCAHFLARARRCMRA